MGWQDVDFNHLKVLPHLYCLAVCRAELFIFLSELDFQRNFESLDEPGIVVLLIFPSYFLWWSICVWSDADPNYLLLTIFHKLKRKLYDVNMILENFEVEFYQTFKLYLKK